MVDIDIDNADVNHSIVNFNTLVLSVAMANGLGKVPNSDKTSIYEVEITADGGQIYISPEDGNIVLINAIIDWGDGSSEEYSTRNSYLHTYEKAGAYRISITADLTTLWGGFQARSNAELKSVIRFADCVTELGIPPNAPYVGNWEYIRLPKTMTVLRNYIFNNSNNNLKYVYGLENVVEIGDNCFPWYGLQNAEILLPKCTSIGTNSFVYTGITKLDAPELTYIGPCALNSTNLKYFNAPKLSNLGGCMSRCNTIEVAHLEGLTSIISKSSEDTFIDLSDLCWKNMTLYVSDSLKNIGEYAFNGSNIVIEYSGTQEQWDAIEKAEYWDSGATITLHCNG